MRRPTPYTRHTGPAASVRDAARTSTKLIPLSSYPSGSRRRRSRDWRGRLSARAERRCVLPCSRVLELHQNRAHARGVARLARLLLQVDHSAHLGGWWVGGWVGGGVRVRVRVRGAEAEGGGAAEVGGRSGGRGRAPHRIPRVGLDGSVPLGDVLALRREVLRRTLRALLLELGVKLGDLGLRLCALGFVLLGGLRLVRSGGRGGGRSASEAGPAEVAEGSCLGLGFGSGAMGPASVRVTARARHPRAPLPPDPPLPHLPHP